MSSRKSVKILGLLALLVFSYSVAHGAITRYQYDTANRLVGVYYEQKAIAYQYDNNGNLLSSLIQDSAPGNVNNDGLVDLEDAILALQVASNMRPGGIFLGSDVDQDGLIGLSEALFILTQVAGR